jgi:4-hydroxy 2-oxovalerate aldolase
MPADISVYVNRLRDLGFTNIGFHPHNNLQMSFANALEAMRVGASFVDATIYGMGRGSGNLPIEILLSYLHKNGETKYNVAPYLDVIERFFLDLMKEYKWGYSLKSLFGGIKNIHPYYVSEVFKQGFYTADEMWSLFDGIKEKCPVSFSKEHLKNALEERFYMPTIDQAKDIILEVAKEAQIIPVEDAFSLNNLPIMNRHKNKKFLIIANGPSVNTYNSQIREYAKNKELVTIGCNYLTNIFEPDYHTFVSKKRFLKYSNAVSEKSLLLVPSFFGKQIVKDNYDRPVEYIEMVSTGDLITKPIDGIKQQHVYLNVAIAAILTAYQMGAEEIMVAGMDGYEKEDSKEIKYFYNEEDVHDDKVVASLRYDYLVVELKRVSDYLYEQGVPLSIITPTSHKKYYKNVLNINL